MKPPARAIAGHIVWGTDGGLWATWRLPSLPVAYRSMEDQIETHSKLRGLLVGLPAESMILSVCERLDPWDVVADMVEGVDLERFPAWSRIAGATAESLDAGNPLFRRRFYISARIADDEADGPLDRLRQFAGRWGTGTLHLTRDQIDTAIRKARAVEARVGTAVDMTPVTAGEIRWLYARSLRREIGEPAFDDSWEPASQQRGGVVAQLTDAVVAEGGARGDDARPRHRRYLRVDAGSRTAFQTVVALADMPHAFTFPGSGEVMLAADQMGFPVDWCIRIRSVPNNVAQPKLRRQHRELIGQFDEYDGEIAGAPPELGDAVAGIEAMRAELAAAPAEPELWATVLFSIAAPTLELLEDRAASIAGRLEPPAVGTGRPTGGQMALTRSFLPGSTAPPVADDYRQYLLARDLAGTGPCTASDVGDPGGLMLGTSLDAGIPAPVLFDAAFGPTVGATASIGVCGALGSGKSFFLKRLCWDTVARGGQVVTIDRTAIGEYVTFAQTAPGRTQIIELGPDTDVCLDPLVCFRGEDRTTVALGFLSLLSGCSTQSEEGATLAEVVHSVADRDGRLSDVVDELATSGETDPVARSLARRLAHYRRLGTGSLAFGSGTPVDLDADLVVFWAPQLALPDRDTLMTEHLARQMLPEQIIGSALLYLVAALGRQVIFSDPSRFGAALYDEAWALLASPHGQRLLREGVRDGRKHNGAVWLASQHPDD
ncbi:MAG: ATP-binding protein, partial [Acidimicrobiales bacterium]|nr:ATP-binding protein [Acidimicrobiales bacterium]